jgi:hypothetical protein
MTNKGNITMDTLMNYFFPKTEMSESTREISVCLYKGNTITVLRLADVKDIPESELRIWGERLVNHILHTFDEEQCENADIILAAIQKRISGQ